MAAQEPVALLDPVQDRCPDHDGEHGSKAEQKDGVVYHVNQRELACREYRSNSGKPPCGKHSAPNARRYVRRGLADGRRDNARPTKDRPRLRPGNSTKW